MNPSGNYHSQPIRSLQTMLRIIAEQEQHQIPLIPDGIYGAETTSAVADFQQSHGLPVTGKTDFMTWDTIVDTYEAAVIEQSPAEPLCITISPGQVIRQGEDGICVALTQRILNALSAAYPDLDAPVCDGQMNSSTCKALESFQRFCGLPETGILDKNTWRHLVLQYPLAERRNIQQK